MGDKTGGSACKVTVDRAKGIVRKSVYYRDQGIENGHDKLLYEYEYLKRMNRENDLFPQVRGCYYTDGYLHVEMEYLYDGESLADIVVDESVTETYVGKSIVCVMEELFRVFYIKQDTPPGPAYWQDCYIERTQRRMERSLTLIRHRFPEWRTLESCIENGMEINGISYAAIGHYLTFLRRDEKIWERLKIDATFCTHHDLIPENILVRRGSESICEFRLIDPRGDGETGKNNRHYLYDMGKMLFGLDCYGLFRRAYRAQRFADFRFDRKTDGGFTLVFNRKSVTVERLIAAQEVFVETFLRLHRKAAGDESEGMLMLLFSAAFMYLPDVPCRMIDEQKEELALAFYARGCMTLHRFFLYAYGKDILSSDPDGECFRFWPTETWD